MPSLANEVLERVTESELGVGDRIFGQIPFDGGSTGDKGGIEVPGDVQDTHLGNNTPLLDGITTGTLPRMARGHLPRAMPAERLDSSKTEPRKETQCVLPSSDREPHAATRQRPWSGVSTRPEVPPPGVA